MSAFDKVIGYTAIKQELLQVCDMIKNREIYKRMGAKPPRGILLSGEPGLGKTLLSRCFVEESGLPSFVIRRDKANGEFISFITESFRQAREQAPSVLVLDDMDKFANEDHEHKNAPEYIAVQAGIDTVADSDVYVFATVNDYYALPDSLRRAGRFDKHLVVEQPSGDDAVAIIKHYRVITTKCGSVIVIDGQGGRLGDCRSGGIRWRSDCQHSENHRPSELPA